MTMRKMLLGLACGALLSAAPMLAPAAEPTLHQVYQAAESGRLHEADNMMAQVLRDHPNSAKAHFVEAELLTKEGRLGEARTELATAERLGPDLGFAKPEALSSLRAKLAETHSPFSAGGAGGSSGSSFPWSWLLIGGCLIAFIVVAARWMQARAAAPQVYAPAGGYGSAAAYGPQAAAPGYGGPMPAQSGGLGSSMLGGLATGVAVGAGVVAGEALMHRVLDGGERNATPHTAFEPTPNDIPDARYDMGGNDFGVSDGGSWDDGSSGGSDDWS